jgi:hypothetical protein
MSNLNYIKIGWSYCRCGCHSNPGAVKHCIPCCDICPICNRGVKGSLAEHIEEIHGGQK